MALKVWELIAKTLKEETSPAVFKEDHGMNNEPMSVSFLEEIHRKD